MRSIDIFESFKRNVPQYANIVKIWTKCSDDSIIIVLTDNSKFFYSANVNGHWQFEELKTGGLQK